MPPCDSVSSTDIQFGPQTNHDRMFEALQMLKLNPVRNAQNIFFSNGSYSLNDNTLTLQGYDTDKRTSLIKQAYSGAVVKAQAKRMGWQLKETAPFKYQVQKRSI